VNKSKRSFTWRTAMVLHRVLKDGSKFTPSGIRAAVEGVDGASARYLTPAARWLRDHGIAVASHKARHLTEWYTPVTAAEMDLYGHQVVRESYSELRANARSCKSLTGPGSRKSRDELVNAAIGLGRYLGMTTEEVVEDCKPLGRQPQSIVVLDRAA
jgi:hypothetical protein